MQRAESSVAPKTPVRTVVAWLVGKGLRCSSNTQRPVDMSRNNGGEACDSRCAAFANLILNFLLLSGVVHLVFQTGVLTNQLSAAEPEGTVAVRQSGRNT